MSKITTGGKMRFKERVKLSGLPIDELIVIGSGALDVRGIREARDIDLVVTESLFQQLQSSSVWQSGKQGSSSSALENGDFEVWVDWSTDGSGRPKYEDLLPETEVIDGLRVVTIEYLMKRKRERGSEKDLTDIAMIEEYLKEGA